MCIVTVGDKREKGSVTAEHRLCENSVLTAATVVEGLLLNGGP